MEKQNSIITQIDNIEKVGSTIIQDQDSNTSIQFLTGGDYHINHQVRGFVDLVHVNSRVGVNVGVSFAF